MLSEHALVAPLAAVAPRRAVILAAGGGAALVAVAATAWAAPPGQAWLLAPAAAVIAAGALSVATLRRRWVELRAEVEQLRAAAEAHRGAASDPAALAHDLRSPLLAVQTHLELVLEGACGAITADARESLGAALRASRRAQAVMEAALRPAEPDGEVADVAAVLEEVVASLAGEIERAGARIDHGRLPIVPAAPAVLYRILGNLVQNAIRYSRPGEPPRIEVSGASTSSGWLIAVRDEGAGIDPVDRDRIFQPRARGGAADGRQGWGLGLATVRDLVDGIGGSVWVDPTVTDGARICVALPDRRGAQPAAAERPAAARA